jgi:arylsulfatase A-like enzyme
MAGRDTRRARGRALLGAALLVCSGCSEEIDPRLNVVLISVDTLRPDILGCYGYPRDTSPYIDALARSGALFENTIAPSPWTLPSHASLLTGLYPRRHGVRTHRSALAKGEATLAEMFRAEGYATAAITNSLNVTPRYGYLRGFERYHYEAERLDRVVPSNVIPLANVWLEEGLREPFFLFLHLYDLHSDYRSVGRHEDRFASPYDGPVDGTTRQLAQVAKGQLTLSEDDRERLLDLYAASIRQVDEEIGRLLTTLHGRGLLARSIVVVTSDHGEEFLEHGGALHGRTQYEEVLKVPLVLRGPGVPKGTRVDAAVSLVDIVPTILALTGAQVPEGLEGRDLTPFLRGNPPENLRDRFVFGDATHDWTPGRSTQSVRYRGFKLVRDADRKQVAVYHLATDPGEQLDVKEAYPELTEMLLNSLDAYNRDDAAGVALPELEPEDAAQLRALGYF